MRRDLQFRVDDGPAATVYTMYGDKTATVANVGPSFGGASLLRGLATGQKLVVKFTDYRDNPHYATIDISGGLASIERVAAACEDEDFEKVMRGEK